MPTYEFKIRYEGDERNWEEMPVDETGEYADSHAAQTHAWKDVLEPNLLDESGTPEIDEIRFNEQGYSQGHYV